ncbi:MAG: hypothetical protein WB643_02430 [Candidatus Bathyarchaeia archaeon]
MTTGSSVSSGITVAIAVGFIAFSVGIGLFVWQQLDQMGANLNLRLVAMGGVITVLGILAARLFARIE